MATAVSLFSGCGGSDKGLVDAGFEILMANDILPYAEEVYRANLPETDFQCCDVTQIRLFPKADLLAGCYPCQGYCQGGARDPDRKINFLYREFDRALRQIRPKIFIVENVPGMLRSDNRRFLNNQLVRYRLAGYAVQPPEILNAADYGLPQNRRRLFLVGIRSDLNIRYEFPQPEFGPGRRKRRRTQKDAISRLPEWPDGEFCDQEFHWHYLSRNRYCGWDEPSKTILSNARHMPLHPMSPRLVKKGPDKWEFDGYADNARRLAWREAAELQGLTKWKFPDTVRIMMKYRVIGNAVPPLMFERVARAVPAEVLS